MNEDRCELLCLDLLTAERVRASRLDAEAADAAAGRARALADPTRLMIAAALRDVDELCVCDLSWVMERSQNLVSHHVRALRHHGVVRSRRDGKMVMYGLTAEGRALLDVVLGLAASTSGERRASA
jgi:DNA-binding transcriptional ArsR family regulator